MDILSKIFEHAPFWMKVAIFGVGVAVVLWKYVVEPRLPKPQSKTRKTKRYSLLNYEEIEEPAEEPSAVELKK